MVWENVFVALTAHEEPYKVGCICYVAWDQIHIKTDLEEKRQLMEDYGSCLWDEKLLVIFPFLVIFLFMYLLAIHVVCGIRCLTQDLAHSEQVFCEWATFLTLGFCLFSYLFCDKVHCVVQIGLDHYM